MSKYLSEIKSRITLWWIAWASIGLTSYFYKEVILFSIAYQSIFFKSKNEQLKVLYFIFTDVTEILLVYLKLVVFFNLQVGIIYLFYHIFIFSIPALFKSEYFNIKLIIKAVSAAYLMSILLSNNFVLPIILDFFLSFQRKILHHSFCLHFEAKLIEYFEFYTVFHYSCVFYCQFFTLFFLILNRISIKRSFIKKYRKLLYYCCLVLATYTSPPEISAQFCIFSTIFFIYELLIILFLTKLNWVYLHR